MKPKAGRRQGTTSITMECCKCGRPVDNVNFDAQKVVCFKCVARELNPFTRFACDSTDRYKPRKGK